MLFLRINTLCADIENHQIHVNINKEVPFLLKQVFEQLTDMSVAQYLDHINYKTNTKNMAR